MSSLGNYSDKKEKEKKVTSTPFDTSERKVERKEEFKLVKVDPKIHSQLKLAALKNDTTMKNLVDEAIREYLKD
ncbi:hypothetical protein [Staphylococcus kloosii]|jgi:predicted HicB family RNase H-like nuclease|uniref:hypothetical protein n=1 Tax=Staphylococcus kloosii TaxID=29384 RepID=UPI00189F9449|nr:hypothetical protein [Staphylococcus kloosii]MBF7023277.1 hypothetical protein [Staphylococcus kloosii]MBF7025998.1 hypothetical protein [Staphylococcus kloosii]